MFNKIPLELRKYNQWICWEDMILKRPINPKYHKNYLASSTNPDTWGTFEQTILAYNKLNVDGIGFVFTEDDDFAGIDLDGCRNPSDETISREAMLIARELNSYTEISPSGRGLHIIFKCRPFRGRKRKKKEVYFSGRYFTMTGRHYDPAPRKIEYRDKELREIIKEYFPSKRVQAMIRDGIIMESPWKKKKD
jgi:putative DNA primase/helicase